MTGALLFRLVAAEQRSFWRRLASPVFTVGLPLVLLALLSYLSTHQGLLPPGGGLYRESFIPAMLAFGVQGVCFNDLAVQLAARRERGLLKRLKLTPIPASSFAAAIVTSGMLVCLLLVVGVTVVGAPFFGLTVPSNVASLVVVVLASAACFSLLGLAVANFVPGTDAAPAVTTAIYVPLNLVSGTFFPLKPGSGLDRVTDLFPVRHAVRGAITAFGGKGVGSRFPLQDVLVLLLWAFILLMIVVKYLRWEPRST
jgi:ABC-2 type transport system permease protein